MIEKIDIQTMAGQRFMTVSHRNGTLSIQATMLPSDAAFDNLYQVLVSPPDATEGETQVSEISSPVEANEANKTQYAHLSPSWKSKFDLFEKIGAGRQPLRKAMRSPEFKALSPKERRRIKGRNGLATLFGPLYYFAKGMWLKGIALSLALWLLYSLLNGLGTAVAVGIAAFIVNLGFAGRDANYEYYQHIVHEKKADPNTLGVVAVLATALVLWSMGFNSGDAQTIQIVKWSSLQTCPDTTLEKMAKGFLASPVWQIERGANGAIFVTVSGDILVGKVKQRAILRFLVARDKKSFTFHQLTFDAIPKDDAVAMGLFVKMCESAHAPSAPQETAQETSAPDTMATTVEDERDHDGDTTRNDIELVKSGIMELDKTLTVGDAFDRWSDCASRQWSEFKSDNGRRIVQFDCETVGAKDYFDRLRDKLSQLQQTNLFLAHPLAQASFAPLDFERACRVTRHVVGFQWTINLDDSFQLAWAGHKWTWENGKTLEEAGDEDDLLRSVYNNETIFDPRTLQKNYGTYEEPFDEDGVVSIAMRMAAHYANAESSDPAVEVADREARVHAVTERFGSEVAEVLLGGGALDSVTVEDPHDAEETPAPASANPVEERGTKACPTGYLDEAGIRRLLVGKTVVGLTLASGNRWTESQAANGTAWFRKTDGNKIEGHWKTEDDRICWCYGGCQTWSCKRIAIDSSCTAWYLDPDTGNKVSRLLQKVE